MRTALETLANRVCAGTARLVRFRSQGRGLESPEGKTTRQEIRLPAAGDQGWLVWGQRHTVS
jgi:hypothetical protein